jgi:hypothetical protein
MPSSVNFGGAADAFPFGSAGELRADADWPLEDMVSCGYRMVKAKGSACVSRSSRPDECGLSFLTAAWIRVSSSVISHARLFCSAVHDTSTLAARG